MEETKNLETTEPIALGLRLRNGKALALVFACDLEQSMATAGTHFGGELSSLSVGSVDVPGRRLLSGVAAPLAESHPSG